MSSFIQTHEGLIFNLEHIERVERQTGSDGEISYVVIYFVSGKERVTYGDHAKIVWEVCQSSALNLV